MASHDDMICRRKLNVQK